MSYIEKKCFVNWRFRSFVQYILSVGSKCIPCYAVKKLHNLKCALQGVDVEIKKCLSFYVVILLKFHTDSAHIMMI